MVARIRDALDRHPDGMHRLADPAPAIDSEIPGAVAELLRSFDGGELFHGSLVILGARELRVIDGRFPVAEACGPPQISVLNSPMV